MTEINNNNPKKSEARKQKSGKGKTKKGKGKLHMSKPCLAMLIVMMIVAAGFLAMLTVVDAFPPKIVMVLVAVLFALLLISGLCFLCGKKWVRVVGTVLAVFFVALYGMSIYYLTTAYAAFSKMSSQDTVQADTAGLNVTEDAFNVYVTGIDQWKEEKGLDLERSDVNMIVTINPKTRKIMLTSIPRDAYVALHRTGTMDKLTHTGIYGVDETLNTVKDWTGLSMDYYVKANFTGFVRLVRAIGGIDIYNPVEFTSALTGHTYPKGNIHLKSYGALYYARERKAFEGQDQLRVKNQLIVVKAIIDKITTSPAIITNYGEILDVLGDEVETNMPMSDMQALIKFQLSDMSKWEIESQRMSGEYEMAVVASMDPSNEYQVLMVDPKTFDSCMKGIDRVMNPTQQEIDEVQARMEAERKEAFFSNFIQSLTHRGDSEDEEAEEEASTDK